jgi:serine/threonine-protein kinase
MQNVSAFASGGVDSRHYIRERLDSWKEIASYFRRDVRTVQLWEKSEGLPVRRQFHKKLGSVYAYRQELEAWLRDRSAHSSHHARSERLRGPSSEINVFVDEPAGHGDFRILALPFEVLCSPNEAVPGRPLVEKFAGGLRNDLIAELSRTQSRLAIVPQAETCPLGVSRSEHSRRLATELGAHFILSGRIRTSAGQLRVTVEVVRTSDSKCVWSECFEEEPSDGLRTQPTLARLMGQSLGEWGFDRVNEPQDDDAARRNMASHSCIVASYFRQRRSIEALRKALRYFLDAVELDPRCADAYAGLSDTYISLSYNHLMPSREAASLAREALRTALKIDENSTKVVNAHINLLMHCSWDLAAAERRCRQTIEFGRADGRTLQLLSSLMILSGRHREAIEFALESCRQEPQVDKAPSHIQVSLAYFYAGDYANAISSVRSAVERQPQHTMGQALLGRIEAQLGNWDDAISAFKRGLELSHGSMFTKALLAYAYVGSGNATRAMPLLRELERESSDECFPDYDVSAVHAILNNEEAALEHLHRACNARNIMTLFARHDPRFARLRNSSGFQRISSRIYPCEVLPPAA